jgi:Ulp1 protease family, C-terminal catalytic domain
MKRGRAYDADNGHVNALVPMTLRKLSRVQDSCKIVSKQVTEYNDNDSTSSDIEISSDKPSDIDVKLEINRFTCLLRNPIDQESHNSNDKDNVFTIHRALSIQVLEPSSWLTSTFMNVVLMRFAKEYQHVHFMPVEFILFGASTSNCETIDIIGTRMKLDDDSAHIIIVIHSANIHWNLLRIIRSPQPEMQLFEPMGKPLSRRGGLSFRSIPRSVITWLDTCCPLVNHMSWIDIGVSAITKPQQINSFDCGVACLLYAEMCGQGYVSGKYGNILYVTRNELKS